MCEPATMLMMASTAVGLISQQGMADAQSASNSRQYDSALQARSENANQIGLRRSQEADSASQKIMANDMAMREAQSTVVAGGGPGGLSVDALLANLGTRGANYNDSVNQNFDRVNLALDSQLTNVNNNAASTINGLRPVEQPDYLGSALRIGGKAYGDYQNKQAKYDPIGNSYQRSNRGSGD